MVDFTQTDDFEGADLGNWSNVAGDQQDWTDPPVSGGTPSTATGPSGASSGSQYIYCETSSPVASDDEFWLQSNTLAGDVYELTIDFEEHMAGAAMDDASGNAYLALEAWKDSTWTEIYRQTGQNGATADGLNWQSKQVVLDSAAGGPYDNSDLMLRFRFHVSSGGSVFQNDAALDLIVITGNNRATEVTVSDGMELRDRGGFVLSGVVKDNAGAVVSGAYCALFKQDGATPAGYAFDCATLSDVDGNYSFVVDDHDAQYMVYALKPGSPNTFDASDNVLQRDEF